MSKEEDSVKEMERESFQFFGTKGKVKWVGFEKSLDRETLQDEVWFYRGEALDE
jgi:hypothetical protein